jgi:hypothetical protein
MPKRLRNLFLSFHRHKEIGKAKAQVNQAEDQKDSTKVARPAIHSQPAIQPRRSSERFHPKDLWQTAYEQLDEKQQQILLRNRSSV